MSKFDYVNRNNNVITFTKLDDQSVIMEGVQFMRAKYDADLYQPDDNVYDMVDPDGGPYLTKGMSLEHINKNWYHLIIRYFSLEDTNKIHIYFYPDTISKNITNDRVIWKIYNTDGEIIAQKDSYEKAIRFIESKYDYDEFGQACKVGN